MNFYNLWENIMNKYFEIVPYLSNEIYLSKPIIGFYFILMIYVIIYLKMNKNGCIEEFGIRLALDEISDSYCIVDNEKKIIGYNNSFNVTFQNIININIHDNLADISTQNSSFNDFFNILIKKIEECKAHGKNYLFEDKITLENIIRKYFKIEIAPIFKKNVISGFLILFKDITEYKKLLNDIENVQEGLIEQERLASLGQLIAGIAHNLKTPLMSIGGALEALELLVIEYKKSIGNDIVLAEDHLEINDDMNSWLDKINLHCSYITDVINTVKAQAKQLNTSTKSSFTVEELIKRVRLLMNNSLMTNRCKLKINSNVNLHLVSIKGEITSLIQVMNNLIQNSIDSYSNHGGEIMIDFSRKNSKLIVVVEDLGHGIPDKIKEYLFKQMKTTKGKNGTGLGLYMSYAIIVGSFEGKMYFESFEGKGSKFYIILPSAFKEEV